MRTPTTTHHRIARLLLAVAATALLTVPHVVQAAPKGGSAGGKGKTTTTGLDVATVVSDLADPVRLGDEVTYRTVVSNIGTTTASSVGVRVFVDHGDRYGSPLGVVIYSSVTTTRGSCWMDRFGEGRELPVDNSPVFLGLEDSWLTNGAYVERGSFPICNVGTLAPGETATIDVVVRPTYPSRYSPFLEGEWPELRAWAIHGLADSNPGNDYDGERTTVTTGSDAGDCVLTGVLGSGDYVRPDAPCARLG